MKKDLMLPSDLYDLIKVCLLSDKQDDEWAKLSRKHASEAKASIRKSHRNKNIELRGNTIKLGKKIIITVQVI